MFFNKYFWFCIEEIWILGNVDSKIQYLKCLEILGQLQIAILYNIKGCNEKVDIKCNDHL